MTYPRTNCPTHTPDEAHRRAEALCAKSEYCRRDIHIKLRTWGVNPAEAERILDQMELERYIDDERFACVYARSKVVHNRWGRRKIAYSLWLRGVSKPNIETALEQLDEEEYAAALSAVVAAKRKSFHGVDTCVERGKILRHAMSKGFECELILAEIRKAKKNKS